MIHLYNMEICPFVQRATIALLFKGVPYEQTFIDPRAKPDWFLAMNPKGKLPVLVDDGKLIAESAVILEYIEDLYPSPPLLPADAYQRSQVRLWTQTMNTEFVPAFYQLLLHPAPASADDKRRKLAAAVRELTSGLLHNGGSGPFYFGDKPSVMDASLAPFIERWSAIEDIGKLPFPDADTAPLLSWYSRICAWEPYRPTRRDAAYWVQVYRDYVAGRWGRTYFEANPGGD